MQHGHLKCWHPVTTLHDVTNKETSEQFVTPTKLHSVTIQNTWPWNIFAVKVSKRATFFNNLYTRAVWKVRGLTLLLRIGTCWRCGGERSGLYGGFSNGIPAIQFFQAEHRIQFRSRHMRFLSFCIHEKGAPRQEISKWLTVCSTFPRSGWSVVRSASLAKGGTSKTRPSPHFHKVPTRSNKVSLRTLQTALVLVTTIGTKPGNF
jgi:hypothetical protein